MKPLNKDYINNFFEFARSNQKPVMRCLFTSFIAFVLATFFSKRIIFHLERICPIKVTFIQNSPTELCFLIFKIVLLLTILFSMPTIIYQTIKYKTKGAIDDNSLKWYRSLLGSILLAFFSIALSLKVIIPGALYLLLALNLDEMVVYFSMMKYISFCLSLIFITTLTLHVPYLAYIFHNSSFKNELVKHKKLVMLFLGAISLVIVVSEEIVSFLLLILMSWLLYFLFVRNLARTQK